MKMNKSKIILICFFVFLLLCVVLVGLYLKFGNKYKEKEFLNNSVNLKYGLISKDTIEGYELNYEGVYNNHYIVKRENYYGVVNNKNEILIPFEYDSCSFFDDIVIAEKKDRRYALSLDNKVLFETDKRINGIQDEIDGTLYFVVYSVGKSAIYDKKFNLLIEVNELAQFSIFDKYLLGNDNVYKLDSDEVIEISSVFFVGDYLIIDYSKKNGYAVYSAKTKETIEYKKMSNNSYSYSFINDSDTFIIDYEGNGFEKGDRKKLLDKYYLDYSVCNDGFAVTDEEGKKIFDNCFMSYDINLVKKGALLLVSSEDLYEYITPSGKKMTFKDSEMYVSGEYLNVVSLNVVSLNGTDSKLYDIEGNSVSNLCNNSLYYVTDDMYLCSTFVSQFILNNKLEVVSGPYENIDCNENKVCLVKNTDKKYGVLFNNEYIVEPNFFEGKIQNDIVILSSNDKNEILYFGKAKELIAKEDLKFNNEIKYKEIDVDNVIKEYSLEEIEDIIKDNEDLFKKYASVIINNSRVDGYKEEILSMFNVIADRKDLNEEYFLTELSKLHIEKVNDLGEGVAGDYSDNRIRIKEDTFDVFSHELMHFFDYNVTNLMDKDIYVCNGEYYSKFDVLDFSLEEQNNCKLFYSNYVNNFILEAGAEVQSFRYSNALIGSYVDGTVIYHALAYLYGDEFMESVFFDKDGDFKLFEKLTKYITPEEYVSFIEAAQHYTNVYGSYDSKVSVVIADTLIKLYEKTKGGNWYEDNEFVFTLSFIISSYDKGIYNFDAELVPDRMSLLTKIINTYDSKYSERVSISGIAMIDGKTYLSIPVWTNNTPGYLKLIYDFENEKIIEKIGFSPEEN